MNPSRCLGLVYLLALPAPAAMLLEAFPLPTGFSLALVVSLMLVMAGTVLSAIAVTKVIGAQYEMKGRRTGLLLTILAVVAYVTGSFLQSDLVHVASTIVLYLGLVFYMAGPRALLPVLPGSLFVLSLFVLWGLGPWGFASVMALCWASITASSVMLIRWRGIIEPIGCGYCSEFAAAGESFCKLCGRMIGRVNPLFPLRSAVGFVGFAVVMVLLLTLAVPLLVFQPAVTPVNIGLEGDQPGHFFAPLPGWRWSTFAPPNGILGVGYDLTKGVTHIRALISTASSSSRADSALKAFRGNLTVGRSLPPALAAQWSGYTVTYGGTKYVILQGVLQAGALNNSRIFNTLLAVDLRETASSFKVDNGSALYGAAGSFSSWAAASGEWSRTAGILLSTYVLFTQVAFLASPTIAVGVLFTMASDDERSKARRLDSTEALPQTVVTVLGAFGSSVGWVTGGWLLDRVKESDPFLSNSSFFSALAEATRRGLASSSIVARNGRPTLAWKSLLR